MQTILHDIPNYLTTLIEALRAKLHDQDFLARHRVRPQDFTRQRQLTFPLLMLFVLQQTIKSIQRHLHEFLDDLAQGQIFEPPTSGAVTHARAKLKESAFTELNRDCVLTTVYGPEHPIERWRGQAALLLLRRLVTAPQNALRGTNSSDEAHFHIEEHQVPKPRVVQPAMPVTNPFDHPDAQRRFRVMTNVEELQRALDFPWEKWAVFGRGLALRGARTVGKEAFKLLDLALLHLADGVAHDLLLVLVSAAARRFRVTESSCPCLSKEYGP